MFNKILTVSRQKEREREGEGFLKITFLNLLMYIYAYFLSVMKLNYFFLLVRAII